MAVDLASAPLLVQQAYQALGPWAREDEGVWDLLQFVYALFNPIVEIDGLVRDTDDYVGWGTLLDADAAPEKVLPWLAQFVGVEPIKGLDEASQRLRIKEAAGFNRGSVSAIEAAAAQYLTGTRRVELYERDTSAWTFRIRTYLSETPDPQKVADAVAALKPGGLVFVYELQAGLEIDQLVGTIDDQALTIAGYSNVVPA
jgi:hypothetical protein